MMSIRCPYEAIMLFLCFPDDVHKMHYDVRVMCLWCPYDALLMSLRQLMFEWCVVDVTRMVLCYYSDVCVMSLRCSYALLMLLSRCVYAVRIMFWCHDAVLTVFF